MAPSSVLPKVPARLKTNSGPRRDRPAIKFLTSACSPKTDTRWPPERSAFATWPTTTSYSLLPSVSRYASTVIFMVPPGEVRKDEFEETGCKSDAEKTEDLLFGVA